MTLKFKFKNADQMKAEGASVDEIAAEAKSVLAVMGAMTKNAKMTADEAREYDAYEGIYDGLVELGQFNKVDYSQLPPGALTGAAEDGSPPYAKGRPIAKDQSFAAYAQAVGYQAPDEVLDALRDEGRDLSLTKYLNGAFTGDWRDARPEQLLNALSGASAGAGGVMLPTILTTRIIDRARKVTRVMQAGATTVPMENKTVDVPRWLTDPALAWRAENAAIAESDPTMDKVTLTAKSLAAVTKVSRELVEDTDIDDQLVYAFGQGLASSVDYAALYGSGASNQPTGVKTDANVTKTALAANGATPTWDNLIDAVGRLRDQNEEPTAQIMSDRTARALAKAKETGTGAYVAPPAYLDGIERYSTAQVPNDLTQGTSNVASDIFTADWTQLIIGVRTQLQITLLTERYMPDAGQYGFVAWWRGDIAVARPKAFDVVIGALA